jgi:hypothetical protein
MLPLVRKEGDEFLNDRKGIKPNAFTLGAKRRKT